MRRGQATNWGIVLGIVLGVIVLISLFLSACGAKGASSSSSTGPVAAPLQPVHIRIELDRTLFNTPALMCHTLLVVEAIPTHIGPGRWNTPSGTRPQLQPSALQQAGYTIYTPFTLGHTHILHDARTQATQDYMMLGGQVGQDSVVYDGYPVVHAGQRAIIVFDPAFANIQAQLLATEVFPIDAQGRVVLQPRTVEQGQVSQQEVTIPLAQLIQDLARC